MSDMEQRVTQITLVPDGHPIFSDGAYRVGIEDHANGEFVVLTDQAGDNGQIAIEPGEWPALRETIDRMVGECRV